jgi:peroxiredoxin
MSNSLDLPPDLPIPHDDGACRHLNGISLPQLPLPTNRGDSVNLAQLTGRTIIFCYPRTGEPSHPVPEGWDAIPGARGCTPQCRSFRDRHRELIAAGASNIFGLSAQETDYQREAAERLALPYDLLSDRDLKFADALDLPTFQFNSMTLIKRLTLIIDDGRITKVLYPVFPPDESAQQTLDWLKANRRQP